MSLKNFLYIILIFFICISCTKKEVKKSIITEKSLDLQVLEAYEEGKEALELGDAATPVKRAARHHPELRNHDHKKRPKFERPASMRYLPVAKRPYETEANRGSVEPTC